MANSPYRDLMCKYQSSLKKSLLQAFTPQSHLLLIVLSSDTTHNWSIIDAFPHPIVFIQLWRNFSFILIWKPVSYFRKWVLLHPNKWRCLSQLMTLYSTFWIYLNNPYCYFFLTNFRPFQSDQSPLHSFDLDFRASISSMGAVRLTLITLGIFSPRSFYVWLLASLLPHHVESFMDLPLKVLQCHLCLSNDG